MRTGERRPAAIQATLLRGRLSIGEASSPGLQPRCSQSRLILTARLAHTAQSSPREAGSAVPVLRKRRLVFTFYLSLSIFFYVDFLSVLAFLKTTGGTGGAPGPAAAGRALPHRVRLSSLSASSTALPPRATRPSASPPPQEWSWRSPTGLQPRRVPQARPSGPWSPGWT